LQHKAALTLGVSWIRLASQLDFVVVLQLFNSEREFSIIQCFNSLKIKSDRDLGIVKLLTRLLQFSPFLLAIQ
jgi:hypothetical protein